MARLGLSFTKGFFGYTGRTRNPTAAAVAMARLGLSFTKGFLGYTGRTRNPTAVAMVRLGLSFTKGFWDTQVEAGTWRGHI